jgi:hypothetical protein
MIIVLNLEPKIIESNFIMTTMRKSQPVFIAGMLFITLVFASGCASYSVHPDAASIVVPKAPTPIPVTVGFVRAEQNATNVCTDLMTKVSKQMEESSLFRTFLYPVRADDRLDGQLVLHLNEQFEIDPELFGKAFITGFFLFLPAPLVTYTHEYHAEGTMDLVRDKQTLKSYTYTVTVDLTHKVFASSEDMTTALEAAVPKALSAELIQQLLNDRSFLEKSLMPTNAVAP